MFEQVEITNFKCIKKADLKLGRLTLFTGVNSSGKSSVIQSLLLLKQNFESQESFLGILNKTSKIPEDELIKTIMSSLKINDKYLDLGIASNLLYENAENDEIKIAIKLESGETSFKCNLKENRDEEKMDCDMEFTGNISDLFKNEKFSYLSAERIVPKSSYEYSKESILKGIIGKNGEYTAHYLAEYKNSEISLDVLKHENAMTNQLLENTSLWLTKISKGIDISAEVNVNLQNSSLKYSYGSKMMMPQNIGFGITYALPIIVSILKAKTGDILIIENPESHLHPSGQVEIARLCAKAAQAGIQIIIETHSDHFLNGIRVATKENLINNEEIKIHYFSRVTEDGEYISKFQEIKVDKNGKIDKWPQGFFDEWDVQLEKLLW